MKILKMIEWEKEGFSTMTILCIFLHLVNYSTFFKVILRHTCQFGRAIGRTFACSEDEKYALLCKIIDQFKFRIHSLHIF